MKSLLYKIALFITLSLSIQPIRACDLCGCSAGNYFLGPTPQFSKYFIGTRYSFRSFNTTIAGDNTQFSKDFYQTTELWGGIKISEKLQTLIFIPYNVNKSKTDDGDKLNEGLGDVTLIGNYSILDKISLTKENAGLTQQLYIGFGLKIPTGKYSINTDEIVSSANSQPGTGSLDYILSTSYNVTLDNWGLASNLNYKINQSASDFRFGNRCSATAFLFRTFQYNQNSFSPTIGILYENLQASELAKLKIESTGGNALLGAVGVETRFKNLSVGINAQLPITQNISDLQTKISLRGMAHLTYSF